MSRRRRATGFSLIELLATLAIMAALLLIVLPVAQLAVQRQREAELRSGLASIRSAIDRYRSAVTEGRVRVESHASSYPPSLDILVEGVEDVTAPDRRKIYFLRRLPRDPFHDGTKEVPASETWGLRSYDSPPDNPAEGEDVFDVYSMDDGVGLNGIPYRDW
jgi:general secretion pathway protein G